MKRLTAIVLGLGLATGATGLAQAQDNTKMVEDAIKARKAQMQLYAFNLGLLGDMAKGAVAYDASAAAAASNNLAMLASLDQSRLWPQGSDNMSVDNTRTLPDLWDNIDDAIAKGRATAEAASAMAAVAGTGLEALQGQMGALGGSCGACHKAYRAPAN